MDEERLTKKEKKEQAKAARSSALSLEKSATKQKYITWGIIAVVAVLFLGFFSYLIYSAKQSRENISVSSGGWVRGNATANNTLYEFGDFQCPACKNFEPMVAQAVKDFKGRIKFIYKHFPLTQIHKNAMNSALAAEAAGKQGKFWEMHDILYEKQDDWAELDDPKPKYEEYAREIGLNTDDFKRDLDGEAGKDSINRDKDFGTELGLRGTPSIFVNGEAFDLQSGGGVEVLKAKVKQAVEEAYAADQ